MLSSPAAPGSVRDNVFSSISKHKEKESQWPGAK